MGYKYISLSESEIITLEQAVKYHPKFYFRTRCKSLLLSNRGYDIKSISVLFQIRIHTVGTWFSNWSKKGLMGLQIEKGRGRKADLSLVSEEVLQDIEEEIKLNPQDLESVCHQISQKWGLSLSKGQLKSFLKKS